MTDEFDLMTFAMHSHLKTKTLVTWSLLDYLTLFTNNMEEINTFLEKLDDNFWNVLLLILKRN